MEGSRLRDTVKPVGWMPGAPRTQHRIKESKCNSLPKAVLLELTA